MQDSRDSATTTTKKDKYAKLDKKYTALLKATARLFERTARRHKSNKDLERTVLYLRSLYNQAIVSPEMQKPSKRAEERERVIDEMESDSDGDIGNRVCFMVREDRKWNVRKAIEKDKGKNEEKVALWTKWMRQKNVLDGV
ncbi:hypothetical protein FGO68_gene16582 [Halteria grandinella]|uniref:Uncharacterized protein n=1 Tax=Halteria grandinella TaxID=5974 RepID=A0A8J8SU74_HALGN|nr:hypothetical protein FGO68_gene16582 [Halteria grandinella]